MKPVIPLILICVLFLSCSRMNPVEGNNKPDGARSLSPAIKLSKGLSISDVDSIIAIVKGDNIIDSLVFPMAWNPGTKRFSGAIDVPEEGYLWTVTVVIMDAQHRKIGQGGKTMNRTTTNLFMDTISCTSALPLITGLSNMVVMVNDSVRLHASVTDSFNGTIRSYEWRIGSGNTFVTSSGPDTVFPSPLVPQESLLCVLRVTDNDGNMVIDTVRVTVVINIPAKMKYIPGGTFTMGDAQGLPDEITEHQVSLSPFFMDTLEVSQAFYDSLLHQNPSYPKGSLLPVNKINWYDALLFCNKRSRLESIDTVYSYSSIIGTPGNNCQLFELVVDSSRLGYRLPTEAEWEYACRGSTTTPYFWGADTLNASNYAWYGTTPHEGGLKQPNLFGLYDMIGNVSEWCQDWYSNNYYAVSPGTNTWGPANATGSRVIRGDCWVGPGEIILRTAVRSDFEPDRTDLLVGFRCVRPVR